MPGVTNASSACSTRSRSTTSCSSSTRSSSSVPASTSSPARPAPASRWSSTRSRSCSAGARGREVVRTGEREAEVAALFEVESGSRVAAKLEAAGVPCDGELVVRRVVQAEGRSRAFLNGKLSTAAQLAELAPDLCDIASQHESVSLTDPATHLEYLDAFGKLDAMRDSLGEKVAELANVVREIDARARGRARSRRARGLPRVPAEGDRGARPFARRGDGARERARAAPPRREARRSRRRAPPIASTRARTRSAISSRASRPISTRPPRSTRRSRRSRARSNAARSELADAARALARYAEGIESNPARLAEVDDRWFRLQKLLRKHGPTTHELLAHRDDAEEAARSARRRRASCSRTSRAKRDACLAAVSAEARTLSRKRRDAAANLADAIGRELAGSAWAARASSSTSPPVPAPAGRRPPAVDGARLTASGIDRVEFLIAPNKGEDPRPLRKIASGGELSRALLALKRVLAEKGPAGLYVFDEVDAGVSGAIAEVIGRAIADVARHRQVLCITHLPQIAALCDHHFVVDKTEAKGRTTSTVQAPQRSGARRRDRAHDRRREGRRGRAPRRRSSSSAPRSSGPEP